MSASFYFPRQLPAKYLRRYMSLTSVFGMGTGGPSSLSTPTIYKTEKIGFIVFKLRTLKTEQSVLQGKEDEKGQALGLLVQPS